jgi:biotin synthase
LIQQIKNKILNGFQIKKEDATRLINVVLEKLSNAFNELSQHFCGNTFDICAIINGKNGRCSENCKFSAQSVHYKVSIEEYPLFDCKKLLKMQFTIVIKV